MNWNDPIPGNAYRRGQHWCKDGGQELIDTHTQRPQEIEQFIGIYLYKDRYIYCICNKVLFLLYE